MKSRWFTFLMGFALTMALGHVSQAAGIISLDLTDNDAAEAYIGGQNIGPLATNSTHWNVTGPDKTSGSNGSGTIANLKNDSGGLSGASVTWASSGTWGNNDTTINDDDHSMAGGYLDDGPGPVTVTFTNVPYANYRVYGLLASGDFALPNSQDWDVNGAWVFGGGTPLTAPAYPNMVDTFAATGSNWALADGTNRGNYWTYESSGSTLIISGQVGSGSDEGSLTGVIIEQVIPEPATSLLAGLALFGLAFGKRCRS